MAEVNALTSAPREGSDARQAVRSDRDIWHFAAMPSCRAVLQGLCSWGVSALVVFLTSLLQRPTSSEHQCDATSNQAALMRSLLAQVL